MFQHIWSRHEKTGRSNVLNHTYIFIKVYIHIITNLLVLKLPMEVVDGGEGEKIYQLCTIVVF